MTQRIKNNTADKIALFAAIHDNREILEEFYKGNIYFNVNSVLITAAHYNNYNIVFDCFEKYAATNVIDAMNIILDHIFTDFAISNEETKNNQRFIIKYLIEERNAKIPKEYNNFFINFLKI